MKSNKRYNIFQDWQANSGNIKGQIVLAAFRLAALMRNTPVWGRVFVIPYLVIYRVSIEWILGIELPWNLSIGPNVRLFHGVGLVINDKVKIGSGVILRQCTTIGVAHTSSFADTSVPVIGDDVDIGANVVIIGKIIIGNGAKIGAGAVVINDVPPNGVVVGNPARLVKQDSQ